MTEPPRIARPTVPEPGIAGAIERVDTYLRHRTGLRGLDPDLIHNVFAATEDSAADLTANDLRDLVDHAKQATVTEQRVAELLPDADDPYQCENAQGNPVPGGHTTPEVSCPGCWDRRLRAALGRS